MDEDASLTDFVSDDDDGTPDQPVPADDADGSEDDADVPQDGSDVSSGDSDTSADEDAGTAGAGESTDADRVPPARVEPATSTAAWEPDGVACSACGTVVTHRWESETGLVCPDCKEW